MDGEFAEKLQKISHNIPETYLHSLITEERKQQFIHEALSGYTSFFIKYLTKDMCGQMRRYLLSHQAHQPYIRYGQFFIKDDSDACELWYKIKKN